MPTVKKAKKTTEVKAGSTLSVKVYDAKGTEKKTVELSKEIFSQKENPSLLAQYVRVYLANQRQGTASAKTRGEVTGSTRKIYRQKGTGKARHGSIKAPIFIGGGVVGGPKPKDYSLKMSKKQRRIAFFVALTLKQKAHELFAADKDLMTIEPKTNLVVHFLSQTGLKNKKVLFVIPKMAKSNFIFAARNISGVSIVDAISLNPYMLLNAGNIIFVDDALSVLEKHFLKNEN